MSSSREEIRRAVRPVRHARCSTRAPYVGISAAGASGIRRLVRLRVAHGSGASQPQHIAGAQRAAAVAAELAEREGRRLPR